MRHHDHTGNGWLVELVNRCQVLSLAESEDAFAQAQRILSTIPPWLPPTEEAVARRVVARTIYAVGRSRGLTRHSPFLQTMVRLMLGGSFQADSVAALDVCDSSRHTPPARRDRAVPPDLGPAATRWVSLIDAIIFLPHDVATISGWSRLAAKSQGVIKTWCAAADISAGDSLDFVRLLRVVIRHAGCHPDWHNMLDIIDQRTLRRLLERSGVGDVDRIPDVATFLERQRLVSSPALLAAVDTRVRTSASGRLVSTRRFFDSASVCGQASSDGHGPSVQCRDFHATGDGD